MSRASTASEPDRGQLRAFYVLQGVYVAFIAAVFLVRGIGLTPEIIFLLLAAGFVWRGRRWQFVRDFAPFVLLLLSYDAMRGFADDLGMQVRVRYVIDWERALFFGHVPTQELQGWLFDPESSRWYDYVAALLHVMHFLVPLLFAALIWQHHREHYWPLVISLVLVSYAGFVTFMLLPTAPPWWAGRMGELEGVRLVHEGLPALSLLYDKLSPNPVAAMPSLHAAYPWLFLLFGLRLWGRRGLAMALYPAAVYAAVVYLGHHYVVDLIGGVIYASATYYVVCGPLGKRSVAAAVALRERWRRRRQRPAREAGPAEGEPLPVGGK